ncbi:hypothetical protein [Hugenholtzia roseola]|uniref:hypothetical protein n=1 Tax=Hugenholtzia roseola TaxID=1002 RepID=UPI00047D88C0|nr:hypothetical protein [Hugenholtzia roseola]
MKRFFLSLIVLGLSLLFFAACDPLDGKRAVTAQQMKEFKKEVTIKQVKEADLLALAGQKAKLFLTESGLAAAPNPLCGENKSPLLDSARFLYIEKVVFWCNKTTPDQAAAMDEKEKLIFEAYQQAQDFTQLKENGDNLQKINQAETILFTAPKGTTAFEGMWSVHINRKKLVREL